MNYGGKIVIEFAGFRPKMYSYLIDDGIGNNKAKETRKCIIEQRLKSEDYTKCFENNQIILKSQQKFKSEVHNIFTEEVNLLTICEQNLFTSM